MSKFLTPPVWYDGVGTLNEMLAGTSVEDGNIVIGKGASSDANVFNSIIIGGSATGGSGSSGQISIGGETSASNTIAIGPSASASATNAMAIGAGATATAQNTIQLGNNSTAYTLNVGDGNSAINGKINVKKITAPSNNVIISGLVPGENYILFIVITISGDAKKYTSYMMVHNSIGDVVGSPIVVLNGKGDLVTYRPVLGLDSSATTRGELYFRYETETSASAATVSNIDVYMMKIS